MFLFLMIFRVSVHFLCWLFKQSVYIVAFYTIMSCFCQCWCTNACNTNYY